MPPKLADILVKETSTMRKLTVDIVDLVCSGKRGEVGNEEQIEE
jgi:hypothetical protein